MSMPKGTKFKSGYATVTNQGLGYREIAEIMTAEGHKMNHHDRNFIFEPKKCLISCHSIVQVSSSIRNC